MSQLRRDPVRGYWCIIAPGRNRRPDEYGDRKVVQPQESGPCPFCPGHEEQTPPEVDAVRPNTSQANAPGWLVRIVPNRFPALVPDDDPEPIDADAGTELYRVVPACGSHEIVIATPEHHRRATHFSVDQWDTLLAASQFRMQQHMDTGKAQHVVLFHNHGEKAGASRAHEHLQLMAIPMTPQAVTQELASCRVYHAKKHRCIFCDLLEREMHGPRFIYADEAFVSFAPWASRVPYEIWILPRAHRHSFLAVPHRERCLLAAHMRELLQRLEVLFGDLPYNWMLHWLPDGVEDASVYHWHIELTPRLSYQAGYEWGTGGFINTTPPEEAAERLRQLPLVAPVTLSR